jgi:hypothetical protein
MVILSIYLSSQVWLQLPDFLLFNKDSSTENLDNGENIDEKVWELVRPHKYIMKDDNKFIEIHLESENLLWESALSSLEVALKYIKESQPNLLAGEFLPSEYIMLEFENKLPAEIFTGKFNVNKENIKTRLNYIEKIVFSLNEPNSIYLFTGDSTVKIKSSKIDNTEIYNYLKNIKESEYLSYKENIEIDGIKVPVPIPDINTALNPVFVKTEFDVKDKKIVEAIAKDYFKNTFDYVRRSEDIDGDIRYIYKNEKELKISPEGLLDFSDPNIDIKNTSNVYTGFLSAIKFASSFLNFHVDMYLSDVQSIQHEGNFGYNFIFTYRIKNKPIIFSKIRENAALEVKVIDNNVVSYKRLIRDLDTEHDDEMKEEKIMSFEKLLKEQVIVDETEDNSNTLRVINKSMIKDINNVYLAYYDLARNPKVQQLIVAWVVDIEDETYVLNALTGRLLEYWSKERK